MKKFDIRTRQGRARRRYNEDLFNPSSLQPHDKAHREDIRFRKKLGRKRSGDLSD